MNVATAYTFPPLQPMFLHTIINRSLRLCYMPSSGIVDSGHLTAITGIPLGRAHQVRGSGARAGRCDWTLRLWTTVRPTPTLACHMTGSAYIHSQKPPKSVTAPCNSDETRDYSILRTWIYWDVQWRNERWMSSPRPQAQGCSVATSGAEEVSRYSSSSSSSASS
jgi:hypothetical protein